MIRDLGENAGKFSSEFGNLVSVNQGFVGGTTGKFSYGAGNLVSINDQRFGGKLLGNSVMDLGIVSVNHQGFGGKCWEILVWSWESCVNESGIRGKLAGKFWESWGSIRH